MKKLLLFIITFVLLASFTNAFATDYISCYDFDSDTNDINLTSNFVNNGADPTGNGKINGAYDYIDSNNDYMTTADPNLYRTGLSVDMWVWFDKIDGSFHRIIAQNDNSAKKLWSFALATDNKLFGRIGTSGTQIDLDSTVALSINTWYHLVWTFNSASKVLTLYINGTAQVGSAGSGTLESGSTPLELGRLGDGSGYFDGKIDELKIYDRVLTPTEVTESFNSYTGVQCISPIADSISTAQVYNATTTENTTEDFFFNVSWIGFNISSVSSRLNYNDTWYSSNLQSSSYGIDGFTYFNSTLITPLIILNNTNITFYWDYNVTHSNGTTNNFNTANNSQSLTWLYPRLNVTAINNYGTPLTTFNVTVDSVTYVTTTGFILIRLPSLDNYSTLIDVEDYFSRTEVVDVSSLLVLKEFNLSQSVISFNAFEKFTNNVIFNFSVNDSTVSDTTINGTAILNLLSGLNQVISFSNEQGYFNSSILVNVSALDVNSETIVMYDKELTVYAYDEFGGTPINNFIVNITGVNYTYTESLSTTSGSVTFELIEGDWTIIIDADNFSFHEVIITVVNQTQSYNATLFTTNSVLLHFLDQNTLEVVTENISISLISEDFANTYNTVSGHLNITNITRGDYEIRFQYATSQLHQSFFTKIDREHDEFNLYMLQINDTDTTKAVILHVSEFGGLPVEDATINILRGYIIDGQYQFLQVGSAKTNVNGETVQYFRLNIAPYKFTIEFDNETVFTSASSQFITSTDTDLFFTINLFGVDYLERHASIDGVSTSLTFVNTSNTTGYFRYQFSSSSTPIKICLDVSRLTSALTTELDKTCSVSFGTAGILLYTINHSLGITATYFGTGTIFQSGDDFEYADDTISKKYVIGALDYDYIGLIFAFIIILGGFFMGYSFSQLKGSLIGLGVAWLIIGLTGLINTGLSISLSAVFLMIGISILIRGRK